MCKSHRLEMVVFLPNIECLGSVNSCTVYTQYFTCLIMFPQKPSLKIKLSKS